MCQLLVCSVSVSFIMTETAEPNLTFFFLKIKEQENKIVHTAGMVYCPVVRQRSCCLWRAEWEVRSPEGWRKLLRSAMWGYAPLLGQESPRRWTHSASALPEAKHKRWDVSKNGSLLELHPSKYLLMLLNLLDEIIPWKDKNTKQTISQIKSFKTKIQIRLKQLFIKFIILHVVCCCHIAVETDCLPTCTTSVVISCLLNL